MNFTTFKKDLFRIFSQDPILNKIPLEKILDVIPKVDSLNSIPRGKIVLVREDLDMPIKDGKVVDVSRIEAGVKTVKYCQKKGWKSVLFGHLGREKKNSLLPVCKAMSEYIKMPIELIEDWLDEKNCRLYDEFLDKVVKANPGSVFMLQNTRKYDLEQSLWNASESSFPNICERMFTVCKDIKERLTDTEINEAIAASNIDFSSSVIPLTMSKTAMGFHLAEEMKTHIKNARKSNFVVFSGLKINKLDDLEGIVERGKLILIIAAGSLATALKKARAQLDGDDYFIGLAETDSNQKTYVDPKRIEQAKRIIEKAEKQGIDFVLPVDFIIDDGKISRNIPKGHAQMDIGPESQEIFEKKIRGYIKSSKSSLEPYSMFFNGVFGKFEDPRFEKGTMSFIHLLKEITYSGISTYVGGGEGRLALLKYGKLKDVTHAFTCGGTVLKSLTNMHIPYLKAMYIQNISMQ